MTLNHSRLIHLNGAAGIGKDTIAQRYIDEHAFALCIRTDDIIATLGQWSTEQNYDPARHLTFDLALSMISTHLAAGHDVIIPHLLTDVEEAQALEEIARRHDAPFIEILLHTNKSDALERVYERGTRGEPGAPPLVPDDRAEFEELYDNVLIAAKTRPGTHEVISIKGEVEKTYAEVMNAIESSLNG